MVHVHAHVHVRTYTYIIHTRTHTSNINFPALNREHAGYIESGASSTECVGHVSVNLKCSSSVVEWMCSSTDADKLNSSSEEQETDNTPITRPLNELPYAF